MAQFAIINSAILFISSSQAQLAECASVLWKTYWNSYDLLDGVARYSCRVSNGDLFSQLYILKSISVGQAAHDGDIVQWFMTLSALCMHGIVSAVALMIRDLATPLFKVQYFCERTFPKMVIILSTFWAKCWSHLQLLHKTCCAHIYYYSLIIEDTLIFHFAIL